MGRRIDTSPPKVCAWALVIVIMALAAPRTAHADDADRAPVIAIDLVSDVAITAGVFDVARTAPAGLVGYALGAPIVHAAYGKWARAGESFGVRLAVPLVGAAIGCGAASGQRGEDDEESCWPGAFAGFAAGMVVAQIVDAAYLSRASDEPTPRMLSIGGAF